MAVEFKIQDFLYPTDILRHKLSLDRSQWFSKEKLEDYQWQRLGIIINHAYTNVPYYKDLFNTLRIKPQDIKSIDDLKILPPLTKTILRKNFKSLIANNASKFNPQLCRTSGTTGEPSEFYQDSSSNILEFCYYWRYWSWVGYRLGDQFAEFTLTHFLNHGIYKVIDYSPLTSRLMLNPSQLSQDNVLTIISAINKYKPKFLKGSPSSIYIFANLIEKKIIAPIKFKAIFTTGELLFAHQRSTIERIFNCKILDSYGHMERTVAICQCPSGKYHINSDYGLLEIDKDKTTKNEGLVQGRILGTSLFNFAMPLIRYEINDSLKIKKNASTCECGRGLPVCETIIGRKQDVISTTDGRFLTNIFVLFDILEGVLWSQLIQEQLNKIKVKLIKNKDFSTKSLTEFKCQLQVLLGNDTEIIIEYLSEDTLPTLLSQKYKPVVSTVVNRVNDEES